MRKLKENLGLCQTPFSQFLAVNFYSQKLFATGLLCLFLIHLHVAGGGGQTDGQPIQLWRDDDLASQAAGMGQAKGQVQHIFLRLGRGGQAVIIVGIDYHMAGGASQAALTGAFQIDLVAVGDFQDGQAYRRIHLLGGTVTVNKGHFGHGYFTQQTAWMD
jgi:hypothetical protein